MSGSGGSARHWRDLARQAALGPGDQAAVGALRQLLTFTLDGAPYAVPVELVREIVRIRPITPVPRVPEDVRGVISLRGEIVQVVDLRRRLGLAPVAPTRASRIIVIHGEERRVTGVLVDAVTEVLRVTEESIRPGGSGESGSVEALCARGEEFVSLLDLTRVLDLHAER
jgi:purine-binding chemotaxis protein CheW